MAFRATARGVFPFQRERALAVHLTVKAGGFETRRIVAGGTVRSGCARGELASVRIFMALPATLVRDGAPEIGPFVAFGTRHCRMFFLQRVLRGGVIELRTRVVVLPAIYTVAVGAGSSKPDFLEGPAVGDRRDSPGSHRKPVLSTGRLLDRAAVRGTSGRGPFDVVP